MNGGRAAGTLQRSARAAGALGASIACAITAMLCAAPARAAPNSRIALERVDDRTGTQIAAVVRSHLERALSRQTKLDVLPATELLALVRNHESQGLGRDEARARAAEETRLAVVLHAAIDPGTYGAFDLALTAHDVGGAVLATSTIRIPVDFERGSARVVPRFNAAHVQRLVQGVLAAADRKIAKPAPQEQPSAPAADPDDSAADGIAGALSAAAATFPIELHGMLATSHWLYLLAAPAPASAARNEVDLQLQASGEAAGLRALASLRVRHDFGYPERGRFEAEELFASYKLHGLSLLVGRTYGADHPRFPGFPFAASPFNPLDERELSLVEPLPLWMARLGYEIGPASIAAYYMPVPTAGFHFSQPDTVDADGRLVFRSRWVKQGELESFFPAGPKRFSLADRAPPPPTPENGQGGLRLAFSVPVFQASLAYGYMFSSVPRLIPQVQEPTEASPYTDIALRAEYPRVHVLAATTSLELAGFRFALGSLAWVDEDLFRIYARPALEASYFIGPFFTDQSLWIGLICFYDFFLFEGQDVEDTLLAQLPNVNVMLIFSYTIDKVSLLLVLQESGLGPYAGAVRAGARYAPIPEAAIGVEVFLLGGQTGTWLADRAQASNVALTATVRF